MLPALPPPKESQSDLFEGLTATIDTLAKTLQHFDPFESKTEESLSKDVNSPTLVLNNPELVLPEFSGGEMFNDPIYENLDLGSYLATPKKDRPSQATGGPQTTHKPSENTPIIVEQTTYDPGMLPPEPPESRFVRPEAEAGPMYPVPVTGSELVETGPMFPVKHSESSMPAEIFSEFIRSPDPEPMKDHHENVVIDGESEVVIERLESLMDDTLDEEKKQTSILDELADAFTKVVAFVGLMAFRNQKEGAEEEQEELQENIDDSEELGRDKKKKKGMLGDTLEFLGTASPIALVGGLLIMLKEAWDGAIDSLATDLPTKMADAVIGGIAGILHFLTGGILNENYLEEQMEPLRDLLADAFGFWIEGVKGLFALFTEEDGLDAAMEHWTKAKDHAVKYFTDVLDMLVSAGEFLANAIKELLPDWMTESASTDPYQEGTDEKSTGSSMLDRLSEDVTNVYENVTNFFTTDPQTIQQVIAEQRGAEIETGIKPNPKPVFIDGRPMYLPAQENVIGPEIAGKEIQTVLGADGTVVESSVEKNTDLYHMTSNYIESQKKEELATQSTVGVANVIKHETNNTTITQQTGRAGGAPSARTSPLNTTRGTLPGTH